MQKLKYIIRLVLRAKLIFKTPKKNNLIIFDKQSVRDLSICLSEYNFFVLQTRIEAIDEVYFSYSILKKIFKNFFKGNLFTVYLISLIELTKPKIVITTIDNSLKFSEVAKVFEKKINFIAIQNATRNNFLEIKNLYNEKKIKHNLLSKYYIPNFFCFGDYERDLYKQLNIKVKTFYPVGSLRLANFFYFTKKENNSTEKYNSDICLVSTVSGAPTEKSTKENPILSILHQDYEREKGFAKIVKYTIKFCIKNNMKLIIACKRNQKLLPDAYRSEINFYKRNLDKEEFDYFKKNLLEKNIEDFSSFRAVLNSKVTVGVGTTLLKDKLCTGGKILSCNLTPTKALNFPINGICSLNHCTFEEFEKRLLEIYTISKEKFFSKIDKKPDYVMKFSQNYSAIDLIREKLSQLGAYKN